RRRVEYIARAIGQRRVQRDEIRPLEKRWQLDLLDADLDGAILREEGIEGDDAHLEADGAVRNDRADIAAADHAERLAEKLDAHESRLFPFARLRRAVRLRNLTGERHQKR